MATNVDLGGNTLIVESIKMGATTPGQGGTTAAGVLGLGVGGYIDTDSQAVVTSSFAVTLSKFAARVTTDALTTAAGASQAVTLTLPGVAAGDMAFIVQTGGTNTIYPINMRTSCTTNTVTVTITNAHASSALNGTITFAVMVYKS